MNGDLMMIFIFVFVFVLPIVTLAIWTGHKKDMAKLKLQLGESEKQNMENEMAAMKTRLEVLEAIVTDKKYQLKEEISSLKVVDK